MKGADASGRVVLAGHSLGGQLAVLSLATLASHVEALFLIAAGTAHWRVWPGRHRWKAAAAVNTFALLNRFLPWYPGRALGFGGEQARRFMRDWSFNALGGRYRLEGSARGTHEIESQLAQVRIPVHVLSIAEDPVAPPGATRELLRLLPNACITHRAVRGVMSDPPWRRHFSWARQECDIEPAIVDGLASVVGCEPSQVGDDISEADRHRPSSGQRQDADRMCTG
jgi:predicted alpha/beta hydrolase